MNDAVGWLGSLVRKMVGAMAIRQALVDRSALADIGPPSPDQQSLYALITDRMGKDMVFDSEIAEVVPLALAARLADGSCDAAMLPFTTASCKR